MIYEMGHEGLPLEFLCRQQHQDPLDLEGYSDFYKFVSKFRPVNMFIKHLTKFSTTFSELNELFG